MKSRKKIPGDKCVDNTLKLLLEGYQFIPNRCLKYENDIFHTRLLGQKVICMSGAEAAKVFYDNSHFTRKGAMPKRIQKTLFGKKGVQTLDGSAHLHRKKLFLSMMTPSRIDNLIQLTKKQWHQSSKQWEKKEQISLFDETQLLLCLAACKWTGVPINRYEVKQRARDFGAMVDAFGGVGMRYWEGKCARKRAEQWIKKIIEEIRSNKLDAPLGSALYDITWHRDLNGILLDTQVAAVELINMIRPIVAIATYIIFGALALKEHPKCLKRLQSKDSLYTTMFVQEVRRLYPFGPFLGARVRNDFLWHNYRFKKRALVLLDLYGTNHDPRLWVLPNRFLPERFQYRKDTPYDFIPQGGGNKETGHRCPGELVTIKIMKVSMGFLANNIDYEVPVQDLSYSLVRMPTLPKSKFIMEKVKRKVSV